jgi:hypothetical protein
MPKQAKLIPKELMIMYEPFVRGEPTRGPSELKIHQLLVGRKIFPTISIFLLR